MAKLELRSSHLQFVPLTTFSHPMCQLMKDDMNGGKASPADLGLHFVIPTRSNKRAIVPMSLVALGKEGT